MTTKLSKIRAFRVPDITIRRYVLDAGTKKYGRDDRGEVLLVDEGAELHVKVRRDSEIMDIIVPLSERFAEWFDLGDASRELLVKVLATEGVEQFIEGLERAGIKTDPTAIVEVVAEDAPDEDSDDVTLAEDLNESLGLAFQQLQISNGRTGSGSHKESLGSQRRRPSQMPSSGTQRVRRNTIFSSPFSTSGRWDQATPSGTRYAIATNGDTVADENIARWTASLSNAKLSDTTLDVFRDYVTPRRALSRAEPSNASVLVFGMATTAEFTFSTPSPQLRVIDSDAGVNNSLGPGILAAPPSVVHIPSEAQADTDTPQSSPNHVNSASNPLTETFRQSNHPWLSQRPPRSSYGGNSFVAEEVSEHMPHEIGFAGEHLVSIYDHARCQASYLTNKKTRSTSFWKTSCHHFSRQKTGLVEGEPRSFQFHSARSFARRTLPISPMSTPMGACACI